MTRSPVIALFSLSVALVVALTGCTSAGTDSVETPSAGAASSSASTEQFTKADAKEAAAQIRAGWKAADRKAWKLSAWAAVDAYPNLLTDAAVVAQAKLQRKAGVFKPYTDTDKFVVDRVYAHSVNDGVEYLVLAGYYRNSKNKPIKDSDNLWFLQRKEGQKWRYAGGVSGSAVPGTTKAKDGLLLSWTAPDQPVSVDTASTGPNQSLLDSMIKAVQLPKPGKTTVRTAGPDIAAGALAWNGLIDASSSRCKRPKGVAAATFTLAEGTLSLVQLDCRIVVKAESGTTLNWRATGTSQWKSGKRAEFRVLYEAVVRSDESGYLVLAHKDHTASIPRMS